MFGTVAVNKTDFVPINVDPLYVSHVIVPDPLVAFGMALAKVAGNVHDVLSPTPDAIVPDWFPKTYLMMWVNDVLARLVEIVIALPNACVDTLSVGVLARGMVGNV